LVIGGRPNLRWALASGEEFEHRKRIGAPAGTAIINVGARRDDDDAITLIESLAGVTGTEADRRRRLFADGDGAAEATAELVAACCSAGVQDQLARFVASGLRNLESYTFCKSHALATARVAWAQCLLRVCYPTAFWLACLNHHVALALSGLLSASGCLLWAVTRMAYPRGPRLRKPLNEAIE
jgi:hypothetical protein